ncbi:hypothetical protein [Tenacibaculum singaporense]|uniref:Uncharacterized protein n=1 Tax=Tenacibaculum singaporense TaxID=2358479 RepID=A0A3S8R3J6_9FLAO|nr:hypothetical protein [Tenacibaculum singaporense]AZJ34395.1 hypothetical protein D6T69_02165 [Tenacibaculum singaporense]
MKKYILILVCFACFFTVRVYSQNYLEYYKKINDAEINNLNGNYAKSDSLYHIAFTLVKKPFKEDYFLAAKNSEKLGDCQTTYNHLQLSLKNGLSFKRIKTKDFRNFKESTFWRKLKAEKKQLEETYLSNINVSLRDEIREMIKQDQKARRPIFGSWKQTKKTDYYNYNRLLKIIEENNNKWPGFSIIGENTPKGKYDVTDNISLMLLHFKRKQIKTLKPYILDAVLKGEMYPYHFARIIDYKYFGDAIKITKESSGKIKINTCNKYGTYLNTKICDCKKAEIEREKIGFEPLKDYYRKRKSKFKCLK